MTIYLWHSTALGIVMGAAILAGNIGLAVEPGSALWWLARPLWMALYIVVLAGLMPVVARFERLRSPPVAAAAWRQVAGAAVFGAGLAVLAYNGIGGTAALQWQIFAALTPLAGALIAGLLTLPRRAAPAPG
jgi:hypothetical protein